ncbi:MAG TPA: nickel ABC transporter permease [Acidimicrobiales bacterium]|nr:nickel ABC transporter permease [Acidimicrobiales bacterium]
MAYVVRRLLLVIPTLLGVSFLAFALANLAPGDPAEQYLRRVLDRVPTPEEITEARHDLGLDRPLVVQFARWTLDAAQGELGTSYASRRPVADEVVERARYSLELAVPAGLLALLVALPVGTICALYRSRPTDQLVRVTALAGASMPSFWLGLLLILLFAVHLSLVPVAGRGGPGSFVLPVVTLALEPAALLSRFTRSTMLETLGEDYIRTARAKGLSRRLVVERHALRNALIPVITYFGTRLGHLVTSAVIVETIFVWPGIGKLTVDAIATRDFPMLQGVVVFAGLTFAIVNLLVDLSYAAIDPRIRLATESHR